MSSLRPSAKISASVENGCPNSSIRPSVPDVFTGWKSEPSSISRSVSNVLLFHAIAARDAQAVESHLQDNVPANSRDQFGVTALMRTVIDRSIVRLLLDKGADPTLKDEQGLDAMDHVCLARESLQEQISQAEGGMKEISERLMAKPSVLCDEERLRHLRSLAWLQEKCDKCNSDLEDLSKTETLIEIRLNSILFHAAESGDLDKARAAIESGADPIALNRDNQSSYMIAWAKKHYDVAAFLKRELNETLLLLVTESEPDRDEIVKAVRAGAEVPVLYDHSSGP